MNKTLRLAVIGCLLLTGANTHAAEIYKWVDEKGRVHYSDKQPPDRQAEQVNPEINVMEATDVKRVTLYATSWCGYCRAARNYFKKNAIAFTEYDIEKDSAARARYDAMGAKGVPVIVVGNQQINGFDEGRFKELFKHSSNQASKQSSK